VSPQLTSQQLAAKIRAFESILNSKRLEFDSLSKIRACVPDLVYKIYNQGPPSAADNQQLLTEAATNYLTAKLNHLSIELQELELTLRMLNQQTSGLVLAVPRA